MRVAKSAVFLAVIVCAIGISMDASAAQFKYRSAPNAASTGINPPDAEYYPDETDVVGGNFFYCSAQLSREQRCYDWLTYYTSTGAQRKACVAVSTNAACQCNLTSGALKGSCKVY